MKRFFNELYLERTITFYSENRAFKIGQRGETIYIVQLTGRVICFVLDLRLSPLATDTLWVKSAMKQTGKGWEKTRDKFYWWPAVTLTSDLRLGSKFEVTIYHLHISTLNVIGINHQWPMRNSSIKQRDLLQLWPLTQKIALLFLQTHKLKACNAN